MARRFLLIPIEAAIIISTAGCMTNGATLRVGPRVHSGGAVEIQATLSASLGTGEAGFCPHSTSNTFMDHDCSEITISENVNALEGFMGGGLVGTDKRVLISGVRIRVAADTMGIDLALGHEMIWGSGPTEHFARISAGANHKFVQGPRAGPYENPSSLVQGGLAAVVSVNGDMPRVGADFVLDWSRFWGFPDRGCGFPDRG